VSHVVLWATTPAQTGADSAIGPVRLAESLLPEAVVPPIGADPPVVAVTPPVAEHLVVWATTPAHTGAEIAVGPDSRRESGPEPAVAEPLPVPVSHLVFLATTPAQTGAETATGPVTLVELRPLVEFELPAAEQVVFFATTPAQTGAATETGPVTLAP
jgi:hypothetical protein